MPESIEAVLTSKLESLKLMSKRLELLDAHDAMYLLKNCYSLPKLNYFLRASPCYLKEDLLLEYDETIRESLVSILNIKLEGPATNNTHYLSVWEDWESDPQWTFQYQLFCLHLM